MSELPWGWIVGIGAALAAGLGCVIFRGIGLRPKAVANVLGTRIEVYFIPRWSLRRLPKSSAFVVFTDETGWMGHGSTKYVKDKADYRLDDRVRALAPIPPGRAISLPVKRLPARLLIVANAYDEWKLTSAQQFGSGFDAAIEHAIRDQAASVILCDPTDDWNYFAERSDAKAAVELIMQPITRNLGKIKAVRILVSNHKNLPAYKQAVQRLSEERWRYAPKHAGAQAHDSTH